MPLVALRYRAGNGKIAQQLAQALPKIVADNLTIPDRHNGQLTAADIEVWCMESTPLDVNPKDLQVIIWAHVFPERSANLESRKEGILEEVRKFLAVYNQALDGFVWVLLSPTAYGEI